METEPVLGIALGGGGARGFVHLGVLQALWEDGDERLRPRVVAGTSTGSVVGALYAAGLTPEELRERGERLGWLSQIIDAGTSLRNTARELAGKAVPLPLRERLTTWFPQEAGRGGLLSNRDLGTWIETETGARSPAQLALPYAAVATEIQAGERVILTSPELSRRRALQKALCPSIPTRVLAVDRLGDAVRASCAIPVIFEVVPVQGLRLLDGGVVEQVPVWTCRGLGADLVLGISLGVLPVHEVVDAPHQAALNALELALRPSLDLALEAADLAVEPPGVEHTSITDFDARDDLIELGRQAMEEKLEALRELVAGFRPPR